MTTSGTDWENALVWSYKLKPCVNQDIVEKLRVRVSINDTKILSAQLSWCSTYFCSDQTSDDNC